MSEMLILFSAVPDLPTDPPEGGQTHIRVQNPRDLHPLADSKPEWGPIYSELTLFARDWPFPLAKTVKDH